MSLFTFAPLALAPWLTTTALALASPPPPPEDFPRHPTLVRVCSQHVHGAPGSPDIAWELWASDLPLDEVVAWYRARLPDAQLAREADGSATWRAPDPAAPRRVLSLYTPAAPAKPSCGTAPPATARTLANFSTRGPAR